MKYIKTFEVLFNNTKGAKFFGDKGSGVLPFNKETKKFLVSFRSKYVNEPNTWNLWGGAIDGDMTPEDSAKKELHEETGYNENIELFSAYVFVAPNDTFRYYNFIGVIENEFTPVLDWETEDYKWVTLEELVKLTPMHYGLKGLLNDIDSMDLIKSLLN